MKSSTVSAERLLRPAEVADLLDGSRHTLKAWRQSTGRSSTSDIPSDNTGATEKKDETPWHLR